MTRHIRVSEYSGFCNDSRSLERLGYYCHDVSVVSMMQGHVTALELQRSISRRKDKDVQGHTVVLSRCYGKLKRVAGINETSCIFEIPEFVIGVPPFEMSKAVTHVIKSLERNGYEVAYMFPRALFISWDLEGAKKAHTEVTDTHSHSHSHSHPHALSDMDRDRDRDIAPRQNVQATPLSHRPIGDFKPSKRFVLNI